MIKITKANSKNDYKIIEILAKEILHEVYDPIIPAEHTEYFLKEFQTQQAIENQIKNENFSYFLLKYNSEIAGYFGIQKTKEKLILSKLYLLKIFRGLKIGKAALKYVDQVAVENNLQKTELIVNRANQRSINVYTENGFKIVEELINSFPNGFTVEDYKMEKTILLKSS